MQKNRFTRLGTAVAAVAMGLGLAAPAMAGYSSSGDTGMSSTGMASSAPDKARFSDSGVNTGAPSLPTTVSMVVAGGGPSDFDSGKLVGVLAGDKTSAEVAKLNKQFGDDKVKSFLTVFTFVVNDSLKKVQEAKIALPSQPSPDPKDGKALSAALYKLGVTPNGTYNVEYMLDSLVSHPIHVAVMDDIDKKFGRSADANYHIVLNQAMADLKSVYGL